MQLLTNLFANLSKSVDKNTNYSKERVTYTEFQEIYKFEDILDMYEKISKHISSLNRVQHIASVKKMITNFESNYTEVNHNWLLVCKKFNESLIKKLKDKEAMIIAS